MTDHRLLDLVDTADFRTLFVNELGWNNPDIRQPVTHIDDDGNSYTLTNVASYRGLRIWVCPTLPPRPVQRRIDTAIGLDSSHERLVIFAGDRAQEWRWPRRAQLGSANAKLVVHEHLIGDRQSALGPRLEAIRLDIEDRPTLVELLNRMRDAFDTEAEKASVAAARLMGTLYTQLDAAGVGEHEATLLLARLLFLMFGDDADMWPKNQFGRFLLDHTTAATLAHELKALFEVLDTPKRNRNLAPDSPFHDFRYINGGLFADPIRLPRLTADFRDALIDACEFDWSIISPAVFGSMFQTVKDKKARRHSGEHYTNEDNILKTIRPLFLDDYKERLHKAWNDKAQLTKLHNEIGRLRALDPACGCGNFLIVAYRELRALELELLVRRRELDVLHAPKSKTSPEQLSMDVSRDVKVQVNHFFGIELHEWPRRIAETAMLLVDHLANQKMAEEFGIAPDRLPIEIAPTIIHGNALHQDWAALVPPTPDVLIFGNPPFGGDRTIDAQQKADLRHAWGGRFTAHLDYVTGWYAKALDYWGDIDGRWAFVSTNSICQGEPVADLWPPILERGWRCRFAHRSFRWETEAVGGKAVVTVSIIGFDRRTTPPPQLWIYPEGGAGEPRLTPATNINPYLGVGPNIIVEAQSTPLAPDLPEVMFGNMARDGGNLLIDPEDYDEVMADPIAAKYVHPFVGADELVKDNTRWCLWLTDATKQDMQASPILRQRIADTRTMRLRSKADSTRKMAETAHLFAQRTQQPGDVLIIPSLVSEHRKYFTVKGFRDGVIASNLVFTAPDPDGLVFAVLSSSMFIAWMRAVGGRLESRLRFSKTLTYNSFPLRELTATQRATLIAKAEHISDVRDRHPGMSLATLYNPTAMPTDLVEAHEQLDVVMDKVFGLSGEVTLADRQSLLFRKYVETKGNHVLI